MSTTPTVRELNEELARKINEEAQQNPSSQYAGKWVGLANGQVAVVANTAEEMARRLRQIEPEAAKTFAIDPNRGWNQCVDIWEMH